MRSEEKEEEGEEEEKEEKEEKEEIVERGRAEDCSYSNVALHMDTRGTHARAHTHTHTQTQAHTHTTETGRRAGGSSELPILTALRYGRPRLAARIDLLVVSS